MPAPPDRSTRLRPLRTRTRRISLACGIATTLLLGSMLPTMHTQDVAHADSSSRTHATSLVNCAPADLFVNTGGTGADRLLRYRVDPADASLELLSDIPLRKSYGDIALSADGLTLYAVTFAGAPQLVTIDRETGAELTAIQIRDAAGTPYPAGFGFNALSLRSNGQLITGSYASWSIVQLDPHTGITSSASEIPGAELQFPVVKRPFALTSGGDFLELDDGRLLGFGEDRLTSGQGDSYIVDLSTGSTKIVGKIPQAYGAAQATGRVFIVGPDGNIRSFDSIPTAANRDLIPSRTDASTPYLLWGAASSQDGTGCQQASMEYSIDQSGHTDPDGSGTVTEGDTVTFRHRLTNTGEATLLDVQLNESESSQQRTCPEVAAGDSCELSIPRLITHLHMTTGATVSSGSARAHGLETLQASHSVTVLPSPQLTLTSTFTPLEPDTARRASDITSGTEIRIETVAHNSGNIPLTGVTLTDTLTGSVRECGTLTLDGQCALTAQYTVTPEDAEAQHITHEATATAAEITPVTAHLNIPVLPSPAMTLSYELTTHDDLDQTHTITAGDTIEATITATNIGDVPLSDVTLSDLELPHTHSCETLSREQTCATNVTFTVTEGDAALGALERTAHVHSAEASPETATLHLEVQPTPPTEPEPEPQTEPPTEPETEPETTEPETGTGTETSTGSGSSTNTSHPIPHRAPLALTGAMWPTTVVAVGLTLGAAGAALLFWRARRASSRTPTDPSRGDAPPIDTRE